MAETITKTVWQYSKVLPPDKMEFLRGVAEDYAKVKRSVYERYSGIRNVDRLTPVFTVMGEMRHCGLREQLKLPAVYYELAVIDAVTDIKGMWSLVKTRVRDILTQNDSFSEQEKKYLRTVLKVNSMFAGILNRSQCEIPDNCKGDELDIVRLNRWLCSRVRKLRATPQISSKDYFRISPSGYRYTENGLCIVSRQPRKRVCIPLRDEQRFDRQMVVNIREDYAALAVPVEVMVKHHEDYTDTVYVHIGYRDMLTLSNGHIYGAGFGNMVSPETTRLNEKNRKRRRLMYHARRGDMIKGAVIDVNNLGLKKYHAQKERVKARMQTYINTELGKLLREEKPGKIVITKPVVKNREFFNSPAANRTLSRRYEGYIRDRLAFKCMQNSVELIEINSKGTGSSCCMCGAEGERTVAGFVCNVCGYKASYGENGARNIEKKYKS